jgi:uncharacterized protein
MNDKDLMTPETAVKVIDALNEGLGEARRIRIHLYGGEPFTNLPPIEAMVKRAHEIKPPRFTFAVTTNGTVLSDGVFDILQEGRFDIILSIDGPADIHDECRRRVDGSPTHGDVIRFLETVRDRTSCDVTGASVIRSGSRLLHASNYLRTLPVQAIKAQAVRLAQGTPWALTDRDMELYLQDLEVIGKQVIEELEADKMPMDKRFIGRILKMLTKGTNTMRYCDAGNTNLGINPQGDILACLLVDDQTARLGHVDDEPRTWRQAGKKWREKSQLREKCQSCSYVKFCGGGCPAVVPVCGDEECKIIEKECDVARSIFEHFSDHPEDLLGLVGL